MAHKMVRQPSETPNINNIDDIVPFRYAYGNQDGYVINKGNELSYTVNGNVFKINSGRVVLQGVEDDIDANGVSFTIDNIASLRYFVIYYRVNLATNITSYEITYDTAGYPTIDAGDDLTGNSSGIANLPLYRFTANSGVISNVEKVVKAVEYINKNTTIENSKKVNDLEIIRDENSVLKIGDIVIPQRQLVWKATGTGYPYQQNPEILNSLIPLKLGDVLEIKLSFEEERYTPFYYKVQLNATKSTASQLGGIGYINHTVVKYTSQSDFTETLYSVGVALDNKDENNNYNSINFSSLLKLIDGKNLYYDTKFYVYEINKIIE